MLVQYDVLATPLYEGPDFKQVQPSLKWPMPSAWRVSLASLLPRQGIAVLPSGHPQDASADATGRSRLIKEA